MTAKEIDVEKYMKREGELSNKVQIDDTHIVIALPEGRIGENYEIALSALKTPEQLVSWIFHLSAKSWIDRDVLRKFIKVASKHLNIEL